MELSAQKEGWESSCGEAPPREPEKPEPLSSSRGAGWLCGCVRALAGETPSLRGHFMPPSPPPSRAPCQAVTPSAETPRLEVGGSEEKHYSVLLPCVTHNGFLYKTPSMAKPVSERKGQEGTWGTTGWGKRGAGGWRAPAGMRGSWWGGMQRPRLPRALVRQLGLRCEPASLVLERFWE